MSQTGAVRIALVHYSYPPVIGGVETVLAAHARLFAEAGHEVTVLCERGESHDARIRIQRCTPGDLREALAAQEIVLVHNVCTMPFDLARTTALLAAARELPAVRFICWVHDIAACNPDYALSAEQLESLGKAHAGFEYVAISEHRREQWAQLTGATARVIPNGVDLARVLDLTPAVAALAEAHALFTREIVLLHPARMLRRKRVEISLRVTAALRATGRDAVLLVTAPADPHSSAGEAYATEMRTLRDSLGLAQTALFLDEDRGPADPDRLQQADLASLYQLADALIFPSRDEGFGLPILEATLHRLPIFCTDLAPLSALASGNTHLFTPDADPTEIARRIARSIAESPAAQARKTVVRDYAWEAIDRNHLAPLLRGD